MLTTQRKALILDRLRRAGGVVAKDLATEWSISEDTVRRDLRELAAEGHLQRVHGGALPLSAAAGDFEARRSVATAEKQRVAQVAATLVSDGQTIFIDGGTTGQALCRALPPSLTATAITHSPTIAVELMSLVHIEVLLIGGQIYRHSVVATGAIAAEQIAGITADVFFMGVSGVHPTAGLTTGSAEEAATKRSISRRSSETYVLASSEKIGSASPFRVVGFGDITGAITDSTDQRVITKLGKAGLNIITTDRR
jgi:DeoR/GlpR family transcriptional regulator of sugar metabolism